MRLRLVRQGKLSPTAALGAQGEDLAHRYLTNLGYRVVNRNWRTFHGLKEADLVAWDAGRLVFVEVKTRRHASDTPPSRKVDRLKQAALRYAMKDFAFYHNLDSFQARFDIIGITLEPNLQIEHDIDAFPLFER